MMDSLPQIVSRVDTLYIDRVDPLYNETYIKLLEKSNEQLSLWTNPLALFIGALGLLFAAGAIASGFHIWFLSSGFNKEKKKLLRDLEKLKDRYHTDLENLFSTQKTQLESTTALIDSLAKDGKLQIDEITKLRGSIHRSTNAIRRASRNVPIIRREYSQGGITDCQNCKKPFPIKITFSENTKIGSNESFKVKCPHCGTEKNIVSKR